MLQLQRHRDSYSDIISNLAFYVHMKFKAAISLCTGGDYILFSVQMLLLLFYCSNLWHKYVVPDALMYTHIYSAGVISQCH